ncbi:FkbM family methyltransferase [Algoriphagus halophilus]|uniref:Methyltransferase FkbM domain-containing protein n=1 Tax=Algoriphagus halophilus TaxID=226505 RepID=A0A1N6ECX8_9BACT|nr:FkbM family methyltransferase [Algoriphagus halophilus]SIN80902.1 Methyltransferase FkbM domain-containing protein [Algoriphagus halophilus]
MFFKSLRVKIYFWRRDFFRKKLLKRIIEFSKKGSVNDLELESIQFIEKNGLCIFPHSFSEKYRDFKTEVFFENSFPYVFHKGRKLFFKKRWGAEQVNHYYKSIVMEQDDESAHLYCDADFTVEAGDILIDLGVAEGNFSIENIEKASRVYLFEKNQDWLEPLEETFKGFEEKVTIVNKFAGSEDSGNSVSLDSFSELFDKSIFIKIDVDGGEREVLKGMQKLLKEAQKIKIAICTYHSQNDAIEFEEYFKKLGFETSFSSGYMLFYHDKKIKAPFLRKGVLRVSKYQ